jgi:hypothetical protein
MGVLRDENDGPVAPLVLQSTKYLPSLAGKRWAQDDEEGSDALSREQQLIIKRSKIDVKIVLRESDDMSKFELFQRINTGGTSLSDQELRNCLLIMADPGFYRWISALGQDPNFKACLALSDRAAEEQYDLELLVRFLVFRRFPDDRLTKIGDLGDLLTDEILTLAGDADFQREPEEAAFRSTFRVLSAALQDDSFRRYDAGKEKFTGGFLISAYEVIALGLGYCIEPAGAVPKTAGDIRAVAVNLWSNSTFLGGIGSGVRASTRIPVTVPLGRQLFC